jgi:hypothetical protein
MPASAARQSANAANARLSTGPRTPEGKARSAANSRKHGLTAQDLVIGPEDREEFDDILANLQFNVAPQGAIQQILFDELVAAAWNLRRIRRMETELCAGAATYLDFLDDDQVQTKLDRLARHKSRIERTFHRCLKELKSLQTIQALGAMASTIEIAKRSQVPDAVTLEWAAPVEAIIVEPRPQEAVLAAGS